MGYIFPWMNKHKPKPDLQKEFDETVAKEKVTPVGIIQVPTQPPYKEKKVTFTKLYMVLIGLLYLAGAMLGAVLVLWHQGLMQRQDDRLTLRCSSPMPGILPVQRPLQ